MCFLCPDTALGHHAVPCRRGGDVVTRHNCLRDTFVDLCHNAHLSVQVEVGTPHIGQLPPGLRLGGQLG